MSFPLLPAWQTVPRPVIGMLHLQPLPGSPRFGGSLQKIGDALLRDAEVLVEGGVHGLMVENFGDAPFYPDRVPAHTVACMTALASSLRRKFAVPMGINVLRNDGRSALAVAAAVGAEFIRVNILCGTRVTDQGVITGVAHELLRERAALGAMSVKILADVNVKHSAPLAVRDVADEVHDLIDRCGADAVIVSGTATGAAVDLTELTAVRAASGATPVFIGSGFGVETARELAALANGFIVGSALKHDGIVTNPVDPARVAALMSRLS